MSNASETTPIARYGEEGAKGYIHQPPKTIDFFGSLALVANNISGPAMMGLPAVFVTAGIIPTVVCILLVWVLSSLCGTFLSETIQKMPGNRNFDQNVDFSATFASVVGQKWYLFVEMLVILSCIVNACAGLVETAQGLDSFLASFVLGKTWGLQVGWDGMSMVEWDSTRCIGGGQHESKTSKCTPFHNVHEGNLISLGYLCCFLVFYPLGRNDLKETMIIQVISFVFFFILVLQFMREFQEIGFPYLARVPLWGLDWKQLAGVVLFNYAYPITIPSWLNEKKHDVSVNKIIWLSSIIATFVYIVFSICAAASFDDPGDDVLVVLSSNKASSLTRIAAASFGVAIIGSGVPVFCVIVRKQLDNSGLMNQTWAKFCGTLFPYLVSWLMYQGKALITVLNWTGLLVNGLIAFILPLVLALVAYRTNYGSERGMGTPADIIGAEAALRRLAVKGGLSPSYKYQSISAAEDALPQSEGTVPPALAATAAGAAQQEEDVELVQPLFGWLEPFRGAILAFGTSVFCFMIISTVYIDAVDGEAPS
jgi:amino acid permease